MKTEQQVMDLFNEANPIPDIDSLDLVDVSATRYLANLNTRSSKMSDAQDTDGTRNNNWAGPLLVAAILVAVLGLAWAIVNNGTEAVPPAVDTTTTTSANTTTTGAATTTTSEAATTTTGPEATAPVIGPFGFEVFTGQTEPGRYETSETDNNFRVVIFDSDGSWNCTRIPCSDGFGEQGVVEFSQRDVTAGFLVFSPSDDRVDDIISELESNEDVVVGPVTASAPTVPEATWTASTFVLSPAEGVPSNVSICGDVPDLPCAQVNLIDRRDTWTSQGAQGAASVNWVVTSPQTIWLITLDSGATVVASAYFSTDWVPSEEEVIELADLASALVGSVVFP